MFAFIAAAAVISIVPFLVGFGFGFSIVSDVVFGAYALISGVGVDLLFRKKLRRDLIAWQRPRVPFIALWVLVCGYVMAFRPFE
jgi:hypothetical protein